MNRMPQKARQELLFPARKKNQAERAMTLKHNPPEEYRLSAYRTLKPNSPTRIIFPGNAFASVIADTAIDIPGATKAQIQRLTKVESHNFPIWGIPRLRMDVVRMAGINKTPDIRTRACFAEWAAYVQISYVKGLVTERSVSNLFAAGGVLNGIGDWRHQKGGLFGEFRTVDESNKDFQRIIKTQGKHAQDEALANPVCYDPDTEELYNWWKAELVIREQLSEDDKPEVRRGEDGSELAVLEA